MLKYDRQVICQSIDTRPLVESVKISSVGIETPGATEAETSRVLRQEVHG